MPANDDAELKDKLLHDILRAEMDVRKAAEGLAQAHAALKEATKALPEYQTHEERKQAFAEADAYLHGLIGDQTPVLFDE